MNFDGMSIFGLSLGGTTLLGAIAGYAAKKVAKLVAILIGLELSLFAALEHKGVITVDWDMLANWTQPTPEMQATLMDILASAGLLGGGFAAGFAIGFKKA